MGRTFELERTQRIARPINEVFAFFADAFNLERITPAFLRFEVRTPGPIEMRVGTLIDYRLRLHGLPIRWRTRISDWSPPHRFVDEQIHGPYRLWVHTHTFRADGEDTVIRDHVRYAMPGGALVHRLWVRRDIERIFEHRRKAIAMHFAEAHAADAAVGLHTGGAAGKSSAYSA